jgi:hypothetical protein
MKRLFEGVFVEKVEPPLEDHILFTVKAPRGELTLWKKDKDITLEQSIVLVKFMEFNNAHS